MSCWTWTRPRTRRRCRPGSLRIHRMLRGSEDYPRRAVCEQGENLLRVRELQRAPGAFPPSPRHSGWCHRNWRTRSAGMSSQEISPAALRISISANNRLGSAKLNTQIDSLSLSHLLRVSYAFRQLGEAKNEVLGLRQQRRSGGTSSGSESAGAGSNPGHPSGTTRSDSPTPPMCRVCS